MTITAEATILACVDTQAIDVAGDRVMRTERFNYCDIVAA
jgi:hypothetical protein